MWIENWVRTELEPLKHLFVPSGFVFTKPCWLKLYASFTMKCGQ